MSLQEQIEALYAQPADALDAEARALFETFGTAGEGTIAAGPAAGQA